MSNYARVCVEIKKESEKKFEEYLVNHPLNDCLSKRYTTDDTTIYDFNCNHYDRMPSLEGWLFDNLSDSDFQVVGVDEYSHWESGFMDAPHIWFDIVIDDSAN